MRSRNPPELPASLMLALRNSKLKRHRSGQGHRTREHRETDTHTHTNTHTHTQRQTDGLPGRLTRSRISYVSVIATRAKNAALEEHEHWLGKRNARDTQFLTRPGTLVVLHRG